MLPRLPRCSKVRFDRPYLHPFQPPGAEAEVKLTIHQQRFKAEGFASTGGQGVDVLVPFLWTWRGLPCGRRMPSPAPGSPAQNHPPRLLAPSSPPPAVWDSSIVLAKMFERHAARFAGKRCLDLSAGCGLPGVVLSKLGARVTATDLAPNLALLEKNAKANGGCCSGAPLGAAGLRLAWLWLSSCFAEQH